MEIPHDHFQSIGAFVYYKKSMVVEAVEFAPPADPVFRGAHLLNELFSKVRLLMQALDPDLLIEPIGLTSKALGIGVYAPDAADDPSARAESIIVFESGYYE